MKPYFLIQGGAFWIGAHYSTDTKRLCINFLPFLTLCLVFEGGQVPRQIRARQEKARQTTEDLAEHLTPAGKLIGVEIAPPCSCYNGTQDPFCWHHGVKISDTDICSSCGQTRRSPLGCWDSFHAQGVRNGKRP